VATYSTKDIGNALRAIAVASEGAAAMGRMTVEQLEAYQAGVRNALVSVGLAFGVEPAVVDRLPAGLFEAEPPLSRGVAAVERGF
jgi:hypothetical protein